MTYPTLLMNRNINDTHHDVSDDFMGSISLVPVASLCSSAADEDEDEDVRASFS